MTWAGARVDAKDVLGNTPLMHCTSVSSNDVCHRIAEVSESGPTFSHNGMWRSQIFKWTSVGMDRLRPRRGDEATTRGRMDDAPARRPGEPRLVDARSSTSNPLFSLPSLFPGAAGLRRQYQRAEPVSAAARPSRPSTSTIISWLWLSISHPTTVWSWLPEWLDDATETARCVLAEKVA